MVLSLPSFLETLKRVIQNSDYRSGYSIPSSFSRGSLHLKKGDYWINLIQPGNTGQPNTVSLQLADGKWISVHQINPSIITAIPYTDLTWFNAASSFFLHDNGGSHGSIVFESVITKGYFLQQSNGHITIGKSPVTSSTYKSNRWMIYNRRKYYSLLITHYSLLIAHCSLLIALCSLLIAHCSLLIAHCSLLIAHCSLLIAHCSLLIAHCSLLIAHCSLLIAHCSLLITHYSLLITHYSLLITHYSLLITYYSLLIIHYSVPNSTLKISADITILLFKTIL